MRITADRHSPYFIGALNIGRYEVLLDGEKVQDCVTADDSRGEATYYVRDGHGNKVISRALNVGVRATRYGRVEIVDLWEAQ